VTYAISLPTNAALAPEALVVDAVRCWRETIDRRRPVLPILFARLETRQAGFLAPPVNALLAMFEAWSGRRFRAGDPAMPSFTDDELHLLALLETATPPVVPAARPSLTAPLRIALRSTRIILRRVLGQERDTPPAGADETPIFFVSGIAPSSRTPMLPATGKAASLPN